MQQLGDDTQDVKLMSAFINSTASEAEPAPMVLLQKLIVVVGGCFHSSSLANQKALPSQNSDNEEVFGGYSDPFTLCVFNCFPGSV